MSGEKGRARAAIVSMALEGRNDADLNAHLLTSYPRLSILPFEEACATLADVMTGPPVVPRLVVLDALVRFATRRPATVKAQPVGGGFDALIAALVKVGLPPDAEPVSGVVQKVRDALSGEFADVLNPWRTFADATAAVLDLTEAEYNKPVCTDTAAKSADGTTDCWEVTVQFDTDLSIDQLANYADPENWPTCSVFFAAMHPASKYKDCIRGGAHWVGTFEEHVDVLTETWITPLQFTFEQDANWVRSDYTLLETTPVILVDEGYVSATTPANPVDPKLPRHVTALKRIAFVDPWLQRWSSLVCDTLWSELCLDAAVNCALGHGPFGV